jgi:hypothetical protein
MRVLLVAILLAAATAFAETLVVKEANLSVDLPEGWKKMLAPPEFLVRADAPGYRVRFFVKKTDIDVKAQLADTNFQAAARQALVPVVFSNVIRSELVQVAGRNAYLFEVKSAPQNAGRLCVVFPHQEAMHAFLFYSLDKPVGGNKDVRSILDSVKFLPSEK